MTYKVTKTYGPEQGLSAAFRQWRADSHCRFIHGYALGFKFTFSCQDLDVRNWCVDFGGLKGLKQILIDNFDHKLLVAQDDPRIGDLMYLDTLGLAEVVVLPAVGCEKFAEYIYKVTEQWLVDAGFGPRCQLDSVEVFEHSGNSAIYTKHVPVIMGDDE